MTIRNTAASRFNKTAAAVTGNMLRRNRPAD
jgi:hypothetical protein